MLDAALAAAWFTLAVLSGVGACLCLSLALDGMRSAWGLMAALMGAATLAVWMGTHKLAAIMLAWDVGRQYVRGLRRTGKPKGTAQQREKKEQRHGRNSTPCVAWSAVWRSAG